MPSMKIILLSALLSFILIFGNGPVHAHVEKGMPDSVAEMEYRILLEFKPGDFASRIKLGMVLLNQNKFKEADKEFHRALTSSPENQQAYIGLSLLHLKQDQTAQALKFIKNAVSLDPENGEVYLHYGKILQSARAMKRPWKCTGLVSKNLTHPRSLRTIIIVLKLTMPFRKSNLRSNNPHL